MTRNAGCGLPGRDELGLNLDVELPVAGRRPHSAASGKQLRLLDLDESEQTTVEPARLLLATAWAGLGRRAPSAITRPASPTTARIRFPLW